ncbi:hypothetical protein [Nonomuraea zeae]|uniref:Uncharacterized protein n=1 Tax=Nonomuraea zeae TaxID=1642303 RepID=A0A5S4GA31_9ACTN|nr:hypothetical protein [Nonomuraea zeae]TMR29301.1 hypothetical protein ETD85_32935 [Nonomuraea zeae]
MTPELKVGDVVEVLSAEEILATLDERGELDNLPFMPEMLRYCGQRLTVHKVANKLCDTMTKTGMRRMNDAVHLTAARCDGSAHGGCQTACLLYFKTAWVKRASGPPTRQEVVPERPLLPLLEINTRRAPGPEGEELFRCQATELLRAAPERLPFRDPGQYVTDIRVGNAGVAATLRTIFLGLFNRYQRLSRRFPRWLRIKGGLAWGFVGPGPHTGASPTGTTDLQPGELVRIKSKDEIIATLNTNRFNRGLGFEEDMARSCGRTARVVARVERCIDEKSGRMLEMKNPCIALDGIICDGVYKSNCPRAFIPFWREIWLERISEPS